MTFAYTHFLLDEYYPDGGLCTITNRDFKQLLNYRFTLALAHDIRRVINEAHAAGYEEGKASKKRQKKAEKSAKQATAGPTIAHSAHECCESTYNCGGGDMRTTLLPPCPPEWQALER